MRADYPNTAVPGRLRDLLVRLPSMGIPERATQKWLASAGYAGGNAMTILPVLRFVGVISQDGSPTALWQALRRGDAQGRREFGDAVRNAYKDLFAIHPHPERLDNDALKNFFRAHTTGGQQVQTRLAQTFRVLSEFADFDGSTSVADAPDGTQKLTGRNSPSSRPTAPRVGEGGLNVTLNLQLQLPATADEEFYDKLFAALRRHLLELNVTPERIE